MTKFFKKSKNPILAPFFPNLGKNEFSCQFLNIPIIYNHAKKQKKLMNHSWEKMPNWPTDGQTDRQTDRQIDDGDSKGPSVGRGSNTTSINSTLKSEFSRQEISYWEFQISVVFLIVLFLFVFLAGLFNGKTERMS